MTAADSRVQAEVAIFALVWGAHKLSEERGGQDFFEIWDEISITTI